jgi:hypothetical protein
MRNLTKTIVLLFAIALTLVTSSNSMADPDNTVGFQLANNSSLSVTVTIDAYDPFVLSNDGHGFQNMLIDKTVDHKLHFAWSDGKTSDLNIPAGKLGSSNAWIVIFKDDHRVTLRVNNESGMGGGI